MASVGFALLKGIVPPRFEHLPYGVSLVWRLNNAVMDEVADRHMPTFAYFQHYRAVNSTLDGITLRLSALIEREGYLAYPVAASQSVHDAGPMQARFRIKQLRFRLGWAGLERMRCLFPLHLAPVSGLHLY